METTALFLKKLREIEIEIRTEKGKLLCNAPKGTITAEISKKIKLRKSEIIAFLQQTAVDNWSSLVAIQPQGNRPPFFCFHGAGGNVLNYSVLVPYLGQDQPLYGLQSRGLDGTTPPIESIESMAAHYVNEITTIQPHGPYYFGGGSMGGMVALEAAQQLQKKGEQIGILVMFDTIGPNQEVTPGGRLIHRIRKHNMMELLSYAKERVSENKLNKQKMADCLAYRQRGEALPHDLRFWFIEKMNYNAMANYEYSVFAGEITLLKGTDEEGGLWSDPLRGWQDMATQGLKINQIPGHHDTLVEKPLLGKILAQCLEQAQKKQFK